MYTILTRMTSFALHIQQSIDIVFLTLFTHSYTLQKLVSQPMQHSNHYILYMSTPSRVFNKFNKFNKLNRFNRFNRTTSRIVAPLPTVCIPLHPLGTKHMEPEGVRTAQPLQSLFPPSPVTLANRHSGLSSLWLAAGCSSLSSSRWLAMAFAHRHSGRNSGRHSRLIVTLADRHSG